MLTMYRILYTSADGARETVTIYSHGDRYGAGVNFCATDPGLPNAAKSTDYRVIAEGASFDHADAYAQRIADLIVTLVPGATIEVDQGDAVAV